MPYNKLARTSSPDPRVRNSRLQAEDSAAKKSWATESNNISAFVIGLALAWLLFVCCSHFVAYFCALFAQHLYKTGDERFGVGFSICQRHLFVCVHKILFS